MSPVSIYPNPAKSGGDIHVKISEGYSDAGTCNISVSMNRPAGAFATGINRVRWEIIIYPGSGQLAAGVYLLKIDFPNAKNLCEKD